RYMSTTQIYTRVSICALKEIHTATHPARRVQSQEADLDSKEEN
ncbi:hypothetical protein Rin_00023370, partial [Candidatus Regiella insecticola 5.15]